MEKAAGTKDVLAEALRAWVACEHPNDARLADVALLVGRAFSEGGASITESCTRSRAFVRSLSQHPSYDRLGAASASVRLARV
jgi:hypothetical protein